MNEQRGREAPTGVPVARMSPAEFRRLGLLQEINRQFLHPRGLALEVITTCGGTGLYFPIERHGVVENRELSELTLEEVMRVIVASYAPETTARLIHGLAQRLAARPEHFGQVWDYREDPEGLAFGEPLDPMAARYANELLEQHRAAREILFGGHFIQPVESGSVGSPRSPGAGEMQDKPGGEE